MSEQSRGGAVRIVPKNKYHNTQHPQQSMITEVMYHKLAQQYQVMQSNYETAMQQLSEQQLLYNNIQTQYIKMKHRLREKNDLIEQLQNQLRQKDQQLALHKLAQKQNNKIPQNVTTNQVSELCDDIYSTLRQIVADASKQ